MTFEELQDLLAEQFSCDTGDLSRGTALADLGADHEDMIELAWALGEAIGEEIDESELSVESVSVGTHVTIQMAGEDEKEEYDIVGRTEADPLNGKISDESPVGHALMGKAVGEKVEVLLPTGQTVEYTVLAITHSAN